MGDWRKHVSRTASVVEVEYCNFDKTFGFLLYLVSSLASPSRLHACQIPASSRSTSDSSASGGQQTPPTSLNRSPLSVISDETLPSLCAYHVAN